ncbi:VOC family protein [Bacillus sp. OK048]|uniref:VOC family protein n=1 Tax=Bacillus sp. OK048 TaxID=1882761 RepID=UPI00088107C9|nr:VOC family protein [Bacillus sp. OK048]SDN38111.1 Glyoxalase/Bleomycin resistance protein/Dioxygenase superfamily protein [Bacillus sp. OK048]
MIKGLHHVQITIPKGTEEEGKKFYCGILGLPEIEKPESLKGRGGFWIKVGDRDVHIGTEDGFDRMSTKAHIAYEVEDIAYWKTRLSNENIKILDAVPIPNYDRFEFRDPFGNRVEMIQNLKL